MTSEDAPRSVCVAHQQAGKSPRVLVLAADIRLVGLVLALVCRNAAFLDVAMPLDGVGHVTQQLLDFDRCGMAEDGGHRLVDEPGGMLANGQALRHRHRRWHG